MGHRIQRRLQEFVLIEKSRNVSAGRKHDPPGGRIRWGEQSGGRWLQRRRNGEAGAEHFLSVGEIDRTITADNAQSNADRRFRGLQCDCIAFGDCLAADRREHAI